MDIVSLDIKAVKTVRLRRHADTRGHLVETWNRQAFAEAGIDVDFVQDNSSLSLHAGTIRGLHFQRPPAAQAKLIRVVAGAILDVAVDLRRASPTFGRHVCAVLTAQNGEQLYIPHGFAHGFCTLQAHTEVAYKVSAPYAPALEAGILWNDPALGVIWPAAAAHPVLSDKDAALPHLADLDPGF